MQISMLRFVTLRGVREHKNDVFPFRHACKIQEKMVKKSTKAKWEFCIVPL